MMLQVAAAAQFLGVCPVCFLELHKRQTRDCHTLTALGLVLCILLSLRNRACTGHLNQVHRDLAMPENFINSRTESELL